MVGDSAWDRGGSIVCSGCPQKHGRWLKQQKQTDCLMVLEPRNPKSSVKEGRLLLKAVCRGGERGVLQASLLGFSLVSS